MQCSTNAFAYNASQCACNPGYIFNTTTRLCNLFNQWGPVEIDSGVDYSITFPESVFSLDTIKRFTQSQAVFLESTLLLLLLWLGFCFVIRLAGPLRDGRSLYFKIRWWISRLDVCFATRHWLEDQKVIIKRKTELGGTFSIASLILFIGLFAALLYQIITKRSVEMHNVRAANAPDLATFLNDVELNITTVSSMSCSHLRGLGTLVTGHPGLIGHRIVPLSTFVNYSCINTTIGPTVSMRCINCQILRDVAYVSWQFVDLPDIPATAIGFLFKLTAKDHGDDDHLSFVSGSLRNASNLNNRPITFRGEAPNILKFNFFPRIYHNKHNLKILQPLFHEFLPGSSFSEISQLQASLQSSDDGLINTTLYVNFLSDYIVEIDSQNILGPVGILADLGGLYCISVGIFFYLMVQCEYRIKRLRNEDSGMRKIRNRRKAQDHWEKLRRYVMYTWAPCSLDDKEEDVKNGSCCAGVTNKSSNKNGSLHMRRPIDSISLSVNSSLPSEKRTVPQHSLTEVVKPHPSEAAQNGPVQENVLDKNVEDVKEGAQMCSAIDCLSLPPPPTLELKASNEISVTDLHKNLQDLYEYNAILREKLIATQAMLNSLTSKSSTSAVDNHNE